MRLGGWVKGRDEFRRWLLVIGFLIERERVLHFEKGSEDYTKSS
jgi:hypothetical protein